MFERHVERELSAYCQGELAPRRRREVSDHLAACARCRVAHDEIQSGIELAGLLPLVEAPAELWQGIEADLGRARARGGARGSPTARTAPVRRGLFEIPVVRWAAAAALLVVIGALVARPLMAPRATSWSVTALAGAPSVGNGTLKGSGRLPVGSWLRT
ncbi:MAG TPA: zf-HC2 domain-containing protein, partial [Candidatus Eisenbacteria bacterium]